jgi:dihydrofolate reductase
VSNRAEAVRTEGETPAAGRREEPEEERVGTLTVIENLTLDGVMQAPGRPDEDERDGFTHGGWAQPYNDPVMVQEMGKGMAAPDVSLLFGRRTYEDFAAYWPKQTGNPFTPVLDARRKYVASTTLTEPLPWQNSVLLGGDAATSVAELKARTTDNLVVFGSGELCRTLVRHGLVDRFLLLVYPLLLGTGRRFFTGPFTEGAAPARLRLVECVSTATGVVITTYVPADA